MIFAQIIRLLMAVALIGAFAACGTIAIVPTPTCQIVPMPTGEQPFPAAFAVEPPSQVTAGDEVQIVFSGGYLIPPTGFQCGDTFTLATPNLATAQAMSRQVRVLLDDQQIHEATCRFDCELTFAIPSDTSPGTYTLTIAANLDSTEFTIEVGEANSP